MTTKRRTQWEKRVTWGEALQIRAVNSPGGLKRQVLKIQHAAGPGIGSRNTFAKLFALDAPPSAAVDPDAALRARLLISALGLDLAEWGVDTIELPPIYDQDRVMALVGADPQAPGGDNTDRSDGIRRLAHMGRDLPEGDVLDGVRAS